MAIFRKIHTSFWSDPFIQSLSPEKKYFFLYLLTNEKTRQCGIYEITLRQISYDTGYNNETVGTLLQYFIKSEKIMFSVQTSEISIKNWNKYNASRSPDVQNLVNKELITVKNKKLIEWLHSVDTVVTLSKSSVRGEPEQEPEGEEEPEREQELEKTAAAEEKIGNEKVKEIANKVWKDQLWKEQVCPGLSISFAALKKWMLLFNASVANDKIIDFTESRYKRMIRGWIAKQQAKGVKVDDGLQKTSSAPPLRKL